MPKFNLTVPHRLSQDEALKRTKGLLEQAKRQHGDKIKNLSERWDGNRGTFSCSIVGYSVDGTLTIGKDQIVLDGTLPWKAVILKPVIASLIRGAAEKALA